APARRRVADHGRRVRRSLGSEPRRPRRRPHGPGADGGVVDPEPVEAHHRNRMKRTRWLFGAAAVAGVVVLVAPAMGQGKAESASLAWSRSRGGPTFTSYDFGAVDGGAHVSSGFRLG